MPKRLVVASLCVLLATSAVADSAGGGTSNVMPSALYTSNNSGTAVTLTASVTTYNILTLNLTPGAWYCGATFITWPAGSTTTTYIQAALTTTSATLPAAGSSVFYVSFGGAIPAGNASSVVIPPQRIVITINPTPLYLVGNVQFSVSTMQGFGQMTCTQGS
jgi:hypothetical protein